MKSTMKAVVVERFGEPDSVQVREVPIPTLGSGQVRVRMLASPVNPSDLLLIRGQHGSQPARGQLPTTPGFEGVGIVEEGRGLLAFRVQGRRVAVLNKHGGNWAEQVIIPARQAVPVPADLTDEQAATFFVNPASALVMTRSVLAVPKGAWLLQTAANGALGRMVVRLGQMYGFRTLNIVRRPEQAKDLHRLGATAVVVVPEEPLHERVLTLTGGEGVRYAIDAVGGALATEVVGCLAADGRMLVYGTLSNEPMSINPRTLMVGRKRIEGFWLSDWVATQGPIRMLFLFRKIAKLLREGVLTTDVSTTFPLTEVHAALRQAEQFGRQGKVLLRIASS